MCKVRTSWLLVWGITDAWYFLLKAVWLYQLKCWSGDFSLGEGSRDQQYPRYLCNITPDMCFSLHHLHTDLPFTWETSQSSYWSCWPRTRLVQNCDVMRYYYFMILKDQCWVISSMIYGDCCQICYTVTLRLSDNINQTGTTKHCQSRTLSAFRGQNMQGLQYFGDTFIHLYASKVWISTVQVRLSTFILVPCLWNGLK